MIYEDPTVAIEELGREKPVGATSTDAELYDVVNRHRAAILEVAGDAQRLHERVSRMIPEAEAKLKAQRDQHARDDGAWEPSGNVTLLRRYIRADGAVQIGRGSRAVVGLDGSIEQEPTEGVLTDPHPCCEAQQKAQRAYRAYGLASIRAKAMRVAPTADPLVRGAFGLLRRSLEDLPGPTGAWFRSMFGNPEIFQRVILNGASTAGGEMLSVPTVAQLRLARTLPRRVAGLIPVTPAPTRSFKRPLRTGRAVATRRTATSDDPSRYPIVGFATSDDTVTCLNYVIQALLDPTWVSDASQLFDVMSEVEAFLSQGIMDTRELIALHADSAGTHQDTIATWTMGSYFTSGQLDGTNSPLGGVLGMRARAHDNSKEASGGGSFDATDHYTALLSLGTWASGAVMITGLYCYYTKFLANSLFTSVQAFGDKATLITGQLGAVGDTPIVISEFMAQEFDTTSGLRTGSNNGGEVLYTNPAAWTFYSLASPADRWDVLYPERGAQYVGELFSEVLSTVQLSTEYAEYVLYNP